MNAEERAAWTMSLLFALSMVANIVQFTRNREMQTSKAKLAAELRSYGLEK